MSQIAIKARTIITMEGERPARGQALYAPLKKIDRGLILANEGRIVAIGKETNIQRPADCPIYDLGNCCLIPGVINCHTHLDLSFLAGKTKWGCGFTPWLESMLPLLPRGQIPIETLINAAEKAIDGMVHTGTRFVGDIAGSAQGVLEAISLYAQNLALNVSHFCEWFGFDDHNFPTPWPSRIRDEIDNSDILPKKCAPAGHALYSTSPRILRYAHKYCQMHNLVFSFHLAESPEETEFLTSGSGPLFELYREKVLPKDWRSPNMRPLTYAAHLKLLGPGSLAVHGTQLDPQEGQILALTGTPLCLCPRSNQNLGLNLPPIQEFIDENILLCLGTDGLTSNSDLDVCNEALFLHERFNLPPELLIRLLTVNAAAALGLKNAGQLKVGSPASVCAIPKELFF